MPTASMMLLITLALIFVLFSGLVDLISFFDAIPVYLFQEAILE